jgi:cholesterol transport system auxiliary component
MNAISKTCVLIACTALVAGCAVMTPPPPEPRKQVITQLPSGLPAGRAHTEPLLVHLPEANPIYDTTEMAYTVKPYQLDYFAKNEWGEKPAVMIHALLVQTLRNAGFKDVQAPPPMGPYKYALRSELVELRQDFTADKPVLRLRMRFQLVDGASQKVKAAREFTEDQPMTEKSPYAGVLAANEATARMLKDAARFVMESAG